MNIKDNITDIAKLLGGDLVLLNGKVLTVDQDDSVAEAVVVKYGLIAYVGKNEEAKNFIKNNTKILDLRRGCLTPGFITTHEHFLIYGYNAVSGMDLWYPRVKSIKDILDILSKKVSVLQR